MIPKIIHYIWFGDQTKKPIERINNWKQKLSNFQFKEWTEKDLDIDKYPYVRTAYDMKRYGICIDPFRPYILYNYGGIWLDTDVNVYKDFSTLLDCSLLVGCQYFIGVSLGFLGVSQNHPVMKKSMEWYDECWTKSTVKKNDVDSFSFAKAHGTNFPPEPLFLSILRKLYNATANNKTKDVVTVDGVIRIMEANALTIRPKNNPENNFCEHLFEGSWCKDVRMRA